MKNKESWQLEVENAKFYEEHFLPALYAQWAPRTVKAAHIRPGNRVLDVGTGTGIVARFAHNQTEPDGSVTGYDINPGMLAVASRIASQIDWVLGPAEKLPFESESFDAVTCQFALMFFNDQAGALREMYRVLKPGGILAVTVWDRMDHAPGYSALANLLAETYGEAAADGLRVPFGLGEPDKFKKCFGQAKLPAPVVQTNDGVVKYPSVAEWVTAEVNASRIKPLLSEPQLKTLLGKAETALLAFTTADGKVRFPISAHLATVQKK